jgi:hypothetical protein
MKDNATLRFDEIRMAECLIGEARLCEKIAAACADELTAAKFKRMARECLEAAGNNVKF